MLARILGWLLTWINEFCLHINNALPTTALASIQSMDGYSAFMSYAGWFNYFVPVSALIAVTATWTSCIAAYYVYQFIMKLLKIGS